MSAVRTVALGELVAPVTSWTPERDDPDGAFTYIDLSAVDQDAKAITGARQLACADAPSRARQLIRTDDVLVSTVRPNLNAVARVPQELDGATASTGFCVVRPRPEKLHGGYLLHWVRSPRFVGDMVRLATGASYPAVSERIVLDSKLPVPPLPEQRRIAEILDKADALRAKRRAALTQLDTLTRSIFLDMFGDPATNPKGIRKRPLGELIKLKSGDFLPAAEMAESGTYAVLGGNGINGFHDEYKFEEPQIVIGRVGAYCGCIHVSPAKSWITDNALYISERDSSLRFDYLVHALTHAQLNQYASQFGQPLVSGSRLYPVPILIPPQAAQQEFVARVARAAAMKDVNENSLGHLNALFSSLQHRAFRGEM